MLACRRLCQRTRKPPRAPARAPIHAHFNRAGADRPRTRVSPIIADTFANSHGPTLKEGAAEPRRIRSDARPQRTGAVPPRVIPGWDQGLIGLCKGAKAILVIPPDMGYGEKGAGDDIPGGATLNFDVEVMTLTTPPEEPSLFAELDVNEDARLSPAEVLTFFQKRNPDMMALPEGLMEKEDTDKDGFISWDEFSGPKGKTPPKKDEL